MSSGQRRHVKKGRLGGGGRGLFTDRESAMRHMRFQGHIRGSSSSSKKRTGNPGLDTGWAHKNAKVFDEKLGIRRNEGLGGQPSMFDDKSVKYIDVNRMVEGLDDIKKTLSTVKKLPPTTKGTVCSDRWADEAAFQDSGGVSGYIARAKNLMDTRKLYVEAIAYLDIAIRHALQNFYITQIEDDEALMARELKATCLLNLANYSGAEKEAAHILLWNPMNGKALYIYGESLYLQCKFERALMIFHRGFRLRTELYSQSFQRGIIKATSVILQTIQTLDSFRDGPEPEKMIPDATLRRLIKRSFFEDDFFAPQPPPSRLILDQEQEDEEEINEESEEDDDMIEFAEKCPSVFSATFLKQIWIKGDDSQHRVKKPTHLKKRNSNNQDLRRLRKDEEFLDSLCTIFSKEQQSYESSFDAGSGYSKHLEESGWDLSMPAPNRGAYDDKIASMAYECLTFIEGRKHFWSLQSKKMPSCKGLSSSTSRSSSFT